MNIKNVPVYACLVILVVFFCFDVGLVRAILTTTQPADREAIEHANRGVAYLEQFRFAEAVAEFEALVELEPESVSALVNLGIAYFNQREFDKAQAVLERAESLSPNNPYVHYNLGLIFKLMGETAKAAAAFEKVAEQDPEDSMTLYYLGTIYASLGRLDDAVRMLRSCIELQPNNEAAHFSLGNVLIRQGKTEEGREELEIFRSLKQSFPADAASAGLQYTELGRYAEAIEETPPPLYRTEAPSGAPEDEEPAVQWVEVSREVGLSLQPLAPLGDWPDPLPAAEFGPSFVEERFLPYFGGGLAFRDLDADGDPDMVVVRAGRPLVFENREGRYRQQTDTGLPEVGRFVGVASGDVDNDGDADLYFTGMGPNALFVNDGTSRFSRTDPQAGVDGNDVSISATFADVDHDGDLDIYVSNYLELDANYRADTIRIPRDLVGAPNRLYRNNGDGSFDEIAAESLTTGGSSRSLGALFSDLDDDRDIDFIVVNDGQAVQAFSNDRVGTFTETAVELGVEVSGRTRGVDSADFDRDGRFDLFFTGEGTALNLLLRRSDRSMFEPHLASKTLMAAGVPGARFGSTFLDADNDADLDLVLVVNRPGALVSYYQNGPEGYRRAASLTVAEGEPENARSLAAADVDRDGDLDIAVATDRGRVLLYRNEGGNSRPWLRILPRGLRSNKDGLGARIEVKAGTVRLKRELRSYSGYLSQNERPAHFGLGSNRAADYIRFLWPGGVKQIEMGVTGGQTVAIEELNRKGTSCPILYAWDGERIRFVTDFLGGAAVGYWLAPGIYNYPDTDEYVKLEAFPPVPKNGTYEIRWVNQLEEVLIYDKASLVVVDHPAELNVFPNERLMPGPPFPEPRLYPVRDPRPPAEAKDRRGRDVTSLVAEKDRRYPGDFELLPFKGYAETHSLTLDLGELNDGDHTVLLLYGWIDYTDSSSNRAAFQAGAKLVTPYLEVGDQNGRFTTVIERMGFPAGLPKTMLVDLEGLVDPQRRWVRITTNQRIYWDQILVATVEPEIDLRVTELSPDRAHLAFRGYPASVNPDGRAPGIYDYSRIAPSEVWDQHDGSYTRFGDVRELVLDVDDRYVITRHGDELALSFRHDRLPPLPKDWKRTFLIYADGFGKDMDLNSAYPNTVAPLPFHGMSAYPYPPDERFPATDVHRRDFEIYHTRRVERQRGLFATTP